MKRQKPQIDEPDNDQLPFQPPEIKYISSVHVIKVPVTDEHLGHPWQLRLYAAELLAREIGDEAQMTGLKVKGPNLFNKTFAKLLRRVPNARLYATIKF
jgi:hypothetical protein